MATNQKNTDTEATQNWPELAIGLFDKLTGRGAQINYQFEDFELDVPARTGGNQEVSSARWRMNGTIRITTSDNEHANGGQTPPKKKND